MIHDFWVPDLAAKTDAIPGHPNYLWIQPNTTGTFLGTCAEYCGAQHALMGIRVMVEPPGEFETWCKSQLHIPAQPTEEAARRGAFIFLNQTCQNCHAINGTEAASRVGPDLTHLADRQTLAAGVLTNSVANLTRWLKDPQRIKPEVNMPDVKLTESQAHDLALYLEGLK